MSQGTLRILTAVVGIPALLAAVYAGTYWFGIVVGLIALVSAYEMGKLLESMDAGPVMLSGHLLSALVVARPWFPYWDAAAVLVFSATVLVTPVLRGDRPAQRLAATSLMVGYPVWLLSFLILIREGYGFQVESDQAFWLTVMFFVMIWASDTFAYYTGRLIGRTPFFPSISPKKTWEGFWGGIVGTVLAGALIKQFQLPFLNWTDTAIIVLICGVIAPVGDLVESRLKRSAETKDSGAILPGHGGILDRFDAMIACAPLVWFYLAYLSGIR
jgi:phosphatidate cytidylyltransferase